MIRAATPAITQNTTDNSGHGIISCAMENKYMERAVSGRNQGIHGAWLAVDPDKPGTDGASDHRRAPDWAPGCGNTGGRITGNQSLSASDDFFHCPGFGHPSHLFEDVGRPEGRRVGKE